MAGTVAGTAWPWAGPTLLPPRSCGLAELLAGELAPCDTLDLQGSTNESGVSSTCLLYTSPSPRDLSTSRMPSSA